jgi:hypothetical protein
MAAVKQNWYALLCVDKQTPEICLEAVKQNSGALHYVSKEVPVIPFVTHALTV